MSDFVADIIAATRRIRAVGLQPDTIIMSRAVFRRIRPRTVRGNAHDRRVIRRRNKRMNFAFELKTKVEGDF